jgi:hypothetical protein
VAYRSIAATTPRLVIVNAHDQLGLIPVAAEVVEVAGPTQLGAQSAPATMLTLYDLAPEHASVTPGTDSTQLVDVGENVSDLTNVWQLASLYLSKVNAFASRRT